MVPKKGKVYFNDEFYRFWGDFIVQIAPALAVAYDRHLRPIAINAFNRWPVKSGLSKSLLTVEYRQDNHGFWATVKNEAPYAGFIKFPRKKKPPGATTVYRHWVKEPVKRAIPLIAQEAKEELLP